jgi:hypothetical protein
LLDADGNTIFINSDDPTSTGSQNSTCFYTDGVLALNGLKFRGSMNNNQSVLQWSLQQDENVASYEVEYADHPSHFKTACKLAAQHTGNYQFIDKENTNAANRFYRLKVVQKGGSYNYSGTLFLSLKDVGMQVYPNPFAKTINVQLHVPSVDNIRFRLVDFYGREVFASMEKLNPGYHSISLTLPTYLAKGMYVMEVLSGTGRLFQQKMLRR